MDKLPNFDSLGGVVMPHFAPTKLKFARGSGSIHVSHLSVKRVDRLGRKPHFRSLSKQNTGMLPACR